MVLGIRWTEKRTKDDILKIIEESLKNISDVEYKILMEAEGIFLDFENKYIQDYIKIIENALKKKVEYLKSGGGTDGR